MLGDIADNQHVVVASCHIVNRTDTKSHRRRQPHPPGHSDEPSHRNFQLLAPAAVRSAMRSQLACDRRPSCEALA
jgi:hypothetical protein